MDDSQTAFATPYSSYGGFDLDMMKVCNFRLFIPYSLLTSAPQRSMDTAGGPDAKKARWSPTSFGSNGLNSANGNNRDAFANYGYGPQAQNGFNSSPPSATFPGANALYTTPNLGMNGNSPNGMAAQLSPNIATAFIQQQQQVQQQQQQQQGQNGNGWGYNMLGIGLPGMGMLGGFPYNAPMGNFNQVS